MPVIISDCAGCKHIMKDKDGKYKICPAFPNGIPDEYYWGKINVREIKKCNKNVGYEEE